MPNIPVNRLLEKAALLADKDRLEKFNFSGRQLGGAFIRAAAEVLRVTAENVRQIAAAGNCAEIAAICLTAMTALGGAHGGGLEE